MPRAAHELEAINTIGNWSSSPDLPYATTSRDKLIELEAITGISVVQADESNIPEIQETHWYPVAEAKAKEAYELNGRSVLIEETSFEFHDLQGSEGKPYPGALVKYDLGSLEQRSMYAEYVIRLAAQRQHPPRATARTVIGAWDGQKFVYREGLVHGTIVMPRGDFKFGFDDIIVPDGQENLPTWNTDVGYRTFAEMTLDEHKLLSARGDALRKLRDKPIELQKQIFMTVEPDPLEGAFAQPELLQNPRAIEFAFTLNAVRGNPPDREFQAGHYEPYYLDEYPYGVKRVVTHEECNDNGCVTSGLDTQIDELGREKRLKRDMDGSPFYFQFGPEQRRRALLARADEYMRYHVDTPDPEDTKEGKIYEGFPTDVPIAYTILRKMISGELQSVPKSNKTAPAIDELLKVLETQEPIYTEDGEHDAKQEYNVALRTLAIATFGEVGYERLCAEGIMSRKINADYGLIFDPRGDGHPGSIFRSGYMPQGSFRDLLVTNALSFMDCGISRNSYLANPDNQLALFIDVRDTLQAMGLPDDIYQLVISKIGIAVGVENPEQVEEDVARFVEAGCKKVRFYSTCNDERRHTVPERIRQRFGNQLILYYMPVVNYEHALELIHPNIAIDEEGLGHGGGRNCDSLGAGGAYTTLKLVNQLYRDTRFNKVSIGVEGGGAGVIAIMPMVDFISKNEQAFGGIIECGGLFVMGKNGDILQPYHGSASVFTQDFEGAMYPVIAARRTTRAGFVRNVEGISNYSRFKRSEPSAVNKNQRLRMYGGLMLADHGVHTIDQLRARTLEFGFDNIVAVSELAAFTAAPQSGYGR